MEAGTRILLNRRAYPLYVGGSAEVGYRDRTEKGSSFLLEARIISPVWQEKDISWEIADTSVVIFDERTDSVKGKKRVRALNTGITTVSAALPDGTCAECIFTVIDNYARMTVAELALNTPVLHLKKGSEAVLHPILYPKDIFRNGAMDTALMWKCSDKSIAVVENGRVIALENGETELIVSSRDTGREARLRIRVSPEAGEGGTEETADGVKLRVGQKLTLPCKSGKVHWQSENRYVVSVDEKGELTALSPSLEQKTDATGMKVWEEQAPVWVYATEEEGGRVTKYPVTVEKEPVPILGLSISPGELVIPVGESRIVTAAAGPSVMRKEAVLWSCGKGDALELEPMEDTACGISQIKVHAKKCGEAGIAACLGNLEASCRVRVTAYAQKTDYVDIGEKLEIDVDQVYQFQPALTADAADKRLHWIISDADIATLDREGNVQGYQPGACEIYAIARDSLSRDQETYLKSLGSNGRGLKGDTRFRELLKTAVYGVCRLQVKASAPCLRNLHIPGEAVTDHSALLLWNRAALLDTGDFTRYRVYGNGKLLAETQKLGYRAEGLNPQTEYRFRVEALDKRGAVLAEAGADVTTKPQSRLLNVLDFGAVGDGRRMDTCYIQKAVNACPPGGTVLLPSGHIFVSGALFLKSNMTFCVDGVLLGSSNPRDYPRVITRWEGWRKLEQPAEGWENSTPRVPENHCPHASLLNAGCYDEGEKGQTGPYHLENLIICGKGQINANGFTLAYQEGPNINTEGKVLVASPVKDATSRGSAIRIHNGRNIYVKDVQTAYAPGWTIHTIFCDRITFDGMELVSQGDGDWGFGSDVRNCGHIYNGDGIDPESCTHVNMFDVYFTTGDDAVAIKSGRNREGNELDKPNAYVRITDCVSKWSLGGFGTGSESASGSHDLLFQNLRAEDLLVSGIWLKTCAERGGVTEYIQVRDLYTGNCDSPVWIFNTYTSTSVQANPALHPPVVRHLRFENVHGRADNKRGFCLEGSEACPIEEAHFRGSSSGGKENRLICCRNVTFS